MLFAYPKTFDSRAYNNYHDTIKKERLGLYIRYIAGGHWPPLPRAAFIIAQNNMIIIGIDPGLALMGYGVIQYEKDKVRLLECGTLVTEAGTALPLRLSRLHSGVRNLIGQYKPDCVAFEELFFGRNVTTAIQVAQARGVAMAAAFDSGAALFEYTPMQIKQAIAGYGHADKKQVQEMVRLLLGMREIIRPDDAADAVACALCHAHSSRFAEAFRIQ